MIHCDPSQQSNFQLSNSLILLKTLLVKLREIKLLSLHLPTLPFQALGLSILVASSVCPSHILVFNNLFSKQLLYPSHCAERVLDKIGKKLSTRHLQGPEYVLHEIPD